MPDKIELETSDLEELQQDLDDQAFIQRQKITAKAVNHHYLGGDKSRINGRPHHNTAWRGGIQSGVGYHR